MPASSYDYKVKGLNEAIDYLYSHLYTMKTNNLLNTLSILSGLEIEVAYEASLQKIEKDTLTVFQQMMVLKIKQDDKISYSIDPVLSTARHSVFGNYYWGEDQFDWYQNSNNYTLLAYHIIEKHDSLHPWLPKIRNYFLESKANRWKNTIDKAQILQTILPGLLQEYDEEIIPASIEISGSVNKSVTHFPYKQNLPAGSSQISIHKTGNGPVYFTTNQSRWNEYPTATDSLIKVESWFEKDGKKTDSLNAGEPLDMKVRLNVSKKASYIMIEVPVPAGCSYDDSDQNNAVYETHRSYYKNKTAIFCKNLNAGTYTFTIVLQPRFSGSYTLNPAKAELMYFPVFYGRNEIRKIIIK